MGIFRKPPEMVRPRSGRCPRCGLRSMAWHCTNAGCPWFVCPKDGGFLAWRYRDDGPEDRSPARR